VKPYHGRIKPLRHQEHQRGLRLSLAAVAVVLVLVIAGSAWSLLRTQGASDPAPGARLPAVETAPSQQEKKSARPVPGNVDKAVAVAPDARPASQVELARTEGLDPNREDARKSPADTGASR
jgi:type IV secretory pathway VirB10-like protein